MATIRNTEYKPPFTWFGGKSAVVSVVWDSIGDCGNVIEPFFGSGAFLFLRPHAPRIETVNDADGLLCNFWRALKHDANAVADAADNPVNECDLHARHMWLVGQRERITDRLCGDPDFFDAKAAGWWCWGINCWIGGGWCSGNGPWREEKGVMVLAENGQVNRQMPHLGSSGQGVNRKMPHLGDAGQGECADRRAWLSGYLRRFSDRLRNVRVCCGDWSRVTGPSVTWKHGTTGVFLDPPYAAGTGRDMGLYAKDCGNISAAVRDWALREGENPLMRIALAGYDGEHAMPNGWRVHEWQTTGGYSLQGAEGSASRANRKRERIWFSPNCLTPGGDLFQ